MDLPKKMYAAYGASTNFKNFQNNPIPEWDALPEGVKAAWAAVAWQAVTHLTPSIEDIKAVVEDIGKTDNLSFGEAMIALEAGKKVTRAIWDGYWVKARGAATWGTETRETTETAGLDLVVAVLANRTGTAPAQPYQSDWAAKDWRIVQ